MVSSFALVLCALAAEPFSVSEAIPQPRVVDARLKLECLVAEPDLVTPTGIAVDDRGRVLVIESHTHFRPKDYAGPQHDRIRLLADTDGDGKLDRASTFFEGTTATMSLALYRDGSLFVATRDEILRLFDVDGDGVAETRIRVCRLETPASHPHSGLSGFAFDFDGDVYFSLGENEGAAYKLIGSDKREIAGGGEGGGIFSCTREGWDLRRVATGFCNPFHLAFDAFGQLFAVDNDPAGRGPCRLLHVVEGGDYGFKTRHGRKGVHPFTAWNGELPGTLPMICGTGEAPCAVLPYDSDHLPEEYAGDLLVTSWGDHRIERYKLQRRGASFASTMKPVVVGGEQFRPVGMALAPDGSVYFTDWVDKSLAVHGKGRIWRLSHRAAKRVKRPTDPWEMILSAHEPTRVQAIERILVRQKAGLTEWGLNGPLDVDKLNESLKKAQTLAPAVRSHVMRMAVRALPFAFSTAEEVLGKEHDSRIWTVAVREAPLTSRLDNYWNTRGGDQVLLAAAIRMGRQVGSITDPWISSDPFIIQAAVQARQAEKPSPITLHPHGGAVLDALTLKNTNLFELLASHDWRLNFMAVRRIGEERLEAFRGDLDERFRNRPASRELYFAYLAALDMLDGVKSEDAERLTDERLLARLKDRETPPAMWAPLLRMILPSHQALATPLLVGYAEGADRALAIEAVRTLRERFGEDRDAALAKLAADEKLDPRVRAEAVMGIPAAESRELLLRLADTAPTPVAVEALRNLEGLDPKSVPVWLKRNNDPDQKDMLLTELWQRATGKYAHERWGPELQANLVGHLGDPEAGERVFFHPRIGICARCHQHSGRGGSVGPDLTHVGERLPIDKLLASFVAPNRAIPPQYKAWHVVLADGRSFTGLLASFELNGDHNYVDTAGTRRRVRPDEIEQRHQTDDSLMPEGLRRTMTKEELRDLLAFLSLGPKR